MLATNNYFNIKYPIYSYNRIQNNKKIQALFNKNRLYMKKTIYYNRV